MDGEVERRVLRAAARVPSGRWGVAVSGGADSVATLLALQQATRSSASNTRSCESFLDAGAEAPASGCPAPDRSFRPGVLSGQIRELVVLHVDHAARPSSGDDAAFVETIAGQLRLPFRATRLAGVAANEAAWRRARLAWFGEVATALQLDGVVLGHHADDLAETVAVRLLRGSPRSGTKGLSPMTRRAIVGGVVLLRPMLGVRRRDLRVFLSDRPFREDSTNAQPITLRNRLRPTLGINDRLTRSLLRLAVAAGRAEAALTAATPLWPDEPPRVDDTADPLVRRAARRWLVDHGIADSDATPAVVDRLLAALDGSGPHVIELPGRLRVRRLGKSRGGGFEITRG